MSAPNSQAEPASRPRAESERAASVMRNQSIDIAKALAICGIVLGHVMRGLSAAAIADPLQGWYEEVDTGLYLVHLSVFFFVSALFLRRGVDREGSSTYLKRRIALLAWLFLAWTLIQGTIQLLSARLVNTPIEPISLVVGLVKRTHLPRLAHASRCRDAAPRRTLPE